jgi:amino acid transporter
MSGALWIFATCSVFLTGFQSALQAVEERAPDVSISRLVVAMLAGIAAAAIFYALLLLSAASAAPWTRLISAELPAAAAFGALPGAAVLRSVVLAVAVISLVKTWNSLIIMSSRLVFAQARHGFLPAPLGNLSAAGAPAIAVVVLTALTSIGILIGRGAVIPIVTTATICVSFSFVVSLLILLRLRACQGEEPEFKVPGGTAAIMVALFGMTGMALVALVEPIMREGSLPIEWLILLAWGGVGAFLIAGRRKCELD